MSDVTCRGSFALGTACGRCSRCRREIESYNAMKSVRDKLNTPSSAISRIEELEAKLAKAVKALQQLVIEYDEVDLAYDEPKSMTAAYGVALDTLAELTGGKDE